MLPGKSQQLSEILDIHFKPIFSSKTNFLPVCF